MRAWILAAAVFAAGPAAARTPDLIGPARQIEFIEAISLFQPGPR